MGSLGGSVAEEDEGRTRDGLVSLVDKSLVLPGRLQDLPDTEETWEAEDTAGDERDERDASDSHAAFGMLETVRAYAEERLAAAGELAAVRSAHARYFLALAERADRELRGPSQRVWYLRLEREHDNLRAALRWLLDQEGPEAVVAWESGLRLATALSYFWFARGYHAEGARWIEEALARAPGADPTVRTDALIRAGRLVTVRGDTDRAQVLLQEALALAEQRDDRVDIAKALSQLGACSVYAGEAAESARLLEAGLRRAQEVDDSFWAGHAFILLSAMATIQGDYARAAACCADALDCFQQSGDIYVAGLAHYGLAQAAYELGEYSRAVAHARAGLWAGADLKERWLIALGAQFALWLAGERAAPSARARLLGAADALIQAIGPAIRLWMWAMRPHLTTLREQLDAEGLGAAYREGRSLPLSQVVAIASHLLDDLARSLAADPRTPDRRADDIPQHARRSEQAEQADGPLSVRERELLRLVAAGLGNPEIARQLALSPYTVRRHLTAVFRTLGVRTRTQAVAVASQRGLL